MPSKQPLSEAFKYDPLTGTLTRRVKRGSSKLDAARELTNSGYLRTWFKGKRYFTHRLVYVMHCGEIPDGMEVDHINQLRTDNRIENLRLASRVDNSRNRTRHSNNISGTTGVHWSKDKGKWRAGIRVNGEYKSLGCFTDLEDAVAARKAAESAYGFHENHDSAKK